MKLVAFLFFFSPYASQADVYLDNFGVGYGILSSGVFTEAVTENGESSLYGSFSYHFLDVNISWAHDTNKFRYHVKTAYTLIPRSSADDAVDVSQWRLSLLLGYEPKIRVSKKLIFTSGLGVLGIISKGNGGPVVQNNGSGTSTFYKPSNTTHSKLLMIEFGFTHHIAKNINYSIDALINGLFGDRRNLNIYMSLNYYWDKGYPRRLKKARQDSNMIDEDAFQAGDVKVKKKRKKKKRRKRRKRRKKKIKKETVI